MARVAAAAPMYVPDWLRGLRAPAEPAARRDAVLEHGDAARSAVVVPEAVLSFIQRSQGRALDTPAWMQAALEMTRRTDSGTGN